MGIEVLQVRTYKFGGYDNLFVSLADYQEALRRRGEFENVSLDEENTIERLENAHQLKATIKVDDDIVNVTVDRAENGWYGVIAPGVAGAGPTLDVAIEHFKNAYGIWRREQEANRQ